MKSKTINQSELSKALDVNNGSIDSDSVGFSDRRHFLKLSVGLSLGAGLAVPVARAEDPVVPELSPPSPPTTPWAEYLPEYVTPLPHSQLSPAPTLLANTAAGEAGRLPHQKWNEVVNFYGYEEYELHAVQLDNWVFNPAYPPQPHWGFQASALNPVMPDVPSVVVHARYGKPIFCRIYNDLPLDHKGFGVPEISTHLHNAHTASESDGFPGDFYSSARKGPTLTKSGKFIDHLYLNLNAGYSTSANKYGDPAEALGTLFYHDHTENFTGPNVYRGLAGFYLLYDEIDSGDENDASPTALRLPSGEFDYPLHLGDRRFDANGMLFYDQLNSDGVLGDKVAINGKIEPVLRVARRKYRLRLLNGGPSRLYQLAILNKKNALQTFSYIASDGNLLPKTLFNQKTVNLTVAERADIIFDFSRYPIGTELFLVNRLEQTSTRKSDKIVTPGVRIMKIVVDRNPVSADNSLVPTVLRPLPVITNAQIAAAPVRQFVFARKGGVWTINDKIADISKPEVIVARNSAEIWELINPSGGWTHPIHMHFEEGRILSMSVNGVAKTIPAHMRGRKDVYSLEPYTTMRVFIRFRDTTGKHVMHCHNLIHEDHAMMLRFDIK